MAEDYPNLALWAQGCVSGRFSEWPTLRGEVQAALLEIEGLRARLREQSAQTLGSKVNEVLSSYNVVPDGLILADHPAEQNVGTCLALLKDEITIANRLLAARQRLLDLFECPVHGQCVPFAIKEVGQMRAVIDAVKKYAEVRPKPVPWAEIEVKWREIVREVERLAAETAPETPPEPEGTGV